MVSIIMPAYNSEEYIHTAISSVISQTYENWELIIINDGSTDNTQKRIDHFEDKRIKSVSQPNNGVSAARNTGLSLMKGKYFCLLDSDDRMPPNSLESRVKIFSDNPSVEFVDGSVEFFDKEFRNRLKKWMPVYRGNPLGELLLLSGKVFFGSTWMIKRIKNKKYSFNQNLRHSEDLLFYINLVSEDSIYDYTEDVILHYRTGHMSAMKSIQGLESGYYRVYKELLDSEKYDSALVKLFKKKARSIVFKSYLGNKSLYKAIAFSLKSWDH